MNLYSKFPSIMYGKYRAKNITTNLNIIGDVLKNYKVFFPYTVKDGERPDMIAADYYKDSYYDWLVYMSNSIIDPYFEWPLSNREFNEYFVQKYGGFAKVKDDVSHYEFTGTTDNTVEEIQRKKYHMTKQTFDLSTPIERKGWSPVSIYDYEYLENEKRKNIRLLSNTYLDQVNREVSKLLNV